MRRVILDLDDSSKLMNITLVRSWQRDDYKSVTDMRSHSVNLTEYSHITFDGENWEDEE